MCAPLICVWGRGDCCCCALGSETSQHLARPGIWSGVVGRRTLPLPWVYPAPAGRIQGLRRSQPVQLHGNGAQLSCPRGDAAWLEQNHELWGGLPAWPLLTSHSVSGVDPPWASVGTPRAEQPLQAVLGAEAVGSLQCGGPVQRLLWPWPLEWNYGWARLGPRQAGTAKAAVLRSSCGQAGPCTRGSSILLALCLAHVEAKPGAGSPTEPGILP